MDHRCENPPATTTTTEVERRAPYVRQDALADRVDGPASTESAAASASASASVAPGPPTLTSHRFKVTVAYDGTDFAGWQTQQGADTIQGRIEQRLSSVFCGARCGVAIAGSGRTDAGVHADAQVFHVDAPLSVRLPEKKTKRKQQQQASHDHGADGGDHDDGENIVAPAQVSESTSTSSALATASGGGGGVKMNERVIDAAAILQILRTGLPPSIQVLCVSPVPRSFHARESCIRKRYEYTVCEGVASPFHARFCHSLGYGKTLDVESMQRAAGILLGRHDFSAFGVIEEGDPRDPVKNMTY